MKKILIATTNPGKFNEINELMAHLDIQLLSLNDFPDLVSPEETGQTYQENALIKAKGYYEQLREPLPVIGEDSGIIVERLAEELGVHTRRWGAGPNASDQEWIDFFLNRMAEFVNQEDRRAHFVSHVILYAPHLYPEHISLEGRSSGYITPTLEAPLVAGVPLSSCFKPDGHGAVYTALPVDVKNQISHRGKAMQKLLIELEKLI